MSRAALVVLSSCLVCLVAPTAFAQDPPPNAPTLDDLAFLVGCWEGELGEPGQRVRETWSAPGGQMMLVTGQMFGPDETMFFEFARVELRDGEIQYVPYPAGRESVPFRLTSAEPGRAVFENPEHDFPQKIVYARDDAGRLTATVSAGEQIQRFSMASVPCRP